MKRIMALLTVFCLLITSMCIVSQAEETPTMLFEMQISGSEDGDGTPAIIEASSETAEYVSDINTTLTSGGTVYAPIYHTYKADEDAEEVPYISFAERTAVDADGNPVDYVNEPGSVSKYVYNNKHARIKVTMDENLNVLASNELTFEMWVRKQPNDHKNSDSGRYLFSWYDSTAKNRIIEAQMHPSMHMFFKPEMKVDSLIPAGTEFNFTSGKNAAGEQTNLQTDYDNKWTHIVITRQWNEGSEGKGTWKSTLYINGVNSGSKTGSTVQRTDYAGSGLTWNVLSIGGTAITESGHSFRGDMAAFRLYDGLLDGEQIQSNYSAELQKYKPLVKLEKISDVEPDAENIKFTFTDDVREDSITEENIVITNSAGNILKTGVPSYDSQTREVTVPIYDFLGYGEEYTIELKDIIDSVYEPIKGTGYKFKSVEKYGVITADLVGGDTVSAADKVTISMPISEDGDYTLVMIVLKDGRIEKVITDSTTIAGTLSVTTDGAVSLGTGHTIKAIAWKYDTEQGAVTISRQLVLE